MKVYEHGNSTILGTFFVMPNNKETYLDTC